MPITWTVDPAERIVSLVYEGDPAFEDFRRAMDGVLADPGYRVGFNFLVDRRRSSEAQTAAYIHAAAAYVEAHIEQLRGSRWAALVKNLTEYGMVRMGQAVTSTLPIEVASFEDEAL